ALPNSLVVRTERASIRCCRVSPLPVLRMAVPPIAVSVDRPARLRAGRSLVPRREPPEWTRCPVRPPAAETRISGCENVILIFGQRRYTVQLTFDEDVEEFRAEFIAFLDEHLPPEAVATERPQSSSHVPAWSRAWQSTQFDHGWLVPGYPPEFGGRNATVLQQYVHREELGRRKIYESCNPQGQGIIAASLITFGTPEQQQRWAVPILRGEMPAALGISEPGAGSDLAGLRTRAARDGDHFVANGQNARTPGAPDPG